MINFPGTTEESWLRMSGHRVKEIVPKLNEYKKNNQQQCPLVSSKKK